MRILAIEHDQPTPPQADLRDILRAEAGGVWDLMKRDIIRELWFTADRHAVVMLECANTVEARKHLATLPLVQTGRIDFTLHELRPYDGFERLFGLATAPNARPPKPAEPPEY